MVFSYMDPQAANSPCHETLIEYGRQKSRMVDRRKRRVSPRSFGPDCQNSKWVSASKSFHQSVSTDSDWTRVQATRLHVTAWKDKSLTAYSHDSGNNENRAKLDFRPHLLPKQKHKQSIKVSKLLGRWTWVVWTIASSFSVHNKCSRSFNPLVNYSRLFLGASRRRTLTKNGRAAQAAVYMWYGQERALRDLTCLCTSETTLCVQFITGASDHVDDGATVLWAMSKKMCIRV